LAGWASRILVHKLAHFVAYKSAVAVSFTPELIESESLMAPEPRPPHPMTPILNSRVSSAAASDEWTIDAEIVAAVAAVNERRDMADEWLDTEGMS
jgi:hypothetical protein